MRIGIDGHDLEGHRTGVGHYLMNILNAWERAGVLAAHDVVVFLKSSVPEDLPHGVTAKVLPPVLGKESTAVFTHWLLPRAATQERIDVLFCPGYVAPRLWKGPVVLTLHDIIYEARPEWFNFQSVADRLLLQYASKRSALRADAILTPSQFSADEVARLYDIGPEKITVTPLGADPIFSTDRDRDRENAVLAEFGLDGPFLFFLGTIQTRRHVPDTIAAFTAVAKRHEHLQYLIAGSNMTKPYVDIAQLVEEANQVIGRDAIRFAHVSREAQPHIYRTASALIWLSDYEGFGLPPLEAMACGAPVITSDATCLPETVGDCALLVTNNDDREVIANAIERVLTDDQLQHRLEECGPTRAAQFSWDRCAKQTLDTLVRVAS